MQSTARDRRTGQFKQIAPRIPPAKKTVAEIHRESGVIAENVRRRTEEARRRQEG